MKELWIIRVVNLWRDGKYDVVRKNRELILKTS